MTATLHKLREKIGERVKRLRLDRRWPQRVLADQLGFSQNRLSEVESGKGSFTAEQLVTILKIFNIPLEDLVPLERPAGDQLHKALAKLGASHLAESAEVLPTDRLREVLVAVPEALASGDPRHITALAPVLVHHAEALSYTRLHAECAALGLLGRLGWVVANTIKALDLSLQDSRLPPKWMIRYRISRLRLDQYLHGELKDVAAKSRQDILDPITTPEAIDETVKEGSSLSRHWNIVTRLRPEDFLEALEAAR